MTDGVNLLALRLPSQQMYRHAVYSVSALETVGPSIAEHDRCVKAACLGTERGLEGSVVLQKLV